MLDNATHVLKTSRGKVEVLSFNTKGDILARFSYKKRAEALDAVKRLTGRTPTPKPMMTPGFEILSLEDTE